MPAQKRQSKPWKRPNPRKRATKLSPAAKASAKAAAKRAGRPYPNLVDNMHAAAKEHQRTKQS